MKKYYFNYVIGILLVLFSTPLGYFSVNKLNEIKGNLSGDYIPLLCGFIFSFTIIGILIFIAGMIAKIKN